MKINYAKLPISIYNLLNEFKIQTKNLIDLKEVSEVIQGYLPVLQNTIDVLPLASKVRFSNTYSDLKLFLIQAYQDGQSKS